MTMIAYATFDCHDAALIQAVSAKVLHMPNTFDPQAIANTLWALALLDDLSPPVWNCLLVSFVQAEQFNSKTTELCMDITPCSRMQTHASTADQAVFGRAWSLLELQASSASCRTHALSSFTTIVAIVHLQHSFCQPHTSPQRLVTSLANNKQHLCC